MRDLHLSYLAKSLGVDCQNGDAVLRGLAIDSRAVKPGDLFVAIVGDRVDGHDFIESALANGAVAIACARPIDTHLPFIQMADSNQVCASFSRLIRADFDGEVIGVTGSAEKPPQSRSLSLFALVRAQRLRPRATRITSLGFL